MATKATTTNTVVTTKTADEIRLERNLKSKLFKRAKKATELGMTLAEYEATLIPVDAETKRLRRNEQSNRSKAKKREKLKALKNTTPVVTADLAATQPVVKRTRREVALANLALANAARKLKFAKI